ncbi:MAG: XRE family transcriptional regulator [Shinella sp.]|nr:MAG: XRE family transcriptional regulator [Shinella sp.]
MKEIFSQNLRFLCANQGAISQVCREIGINRQQFDRYVKGGSLPAAQNLRKISSYFKISEGDLFEPTDIFQRKYQTHTRAEARPPVDIFSASFANQSKRMRRYLGYYHVYVSTPTWGGQIMCSLTCLFEQNGYVVSRTAERARSKDGSIRQRARFEGLSSFHGDRIYVIEREAGEDGSVAQTILCPAHRQQVHYLRGIALGVASRPSLAPYFSRTIWKRISERVSAREALQACGVYKIDSRRLEPPVREFLKAPTENLPF